MGSLDSSVEKYWNNKDRHPLLYTKIKSRKYSNKLLSPLISPRQPQPPALNPSRRQAPAIILGLNYLESTAFTGISTNLVVYLRTVLHQSNTWNAANFSVWSGTCYFMPLIGAIISDSFLGNYRTLFLSSFLYLLGLTIITLTALNPSLQNFACDGFSCQQPSWVKYMTIFSGLYLVAVGSGGVKSALLPLGADQFDESIPEQKQSKISFFNKFYVALILGTLTSGVVVVWIQTNVDWALGFGITTVCMAVALAWFVLGTPAYKIKTPSGTPLKSIIQVVVAACKKAKVELPVDSSCLYEISDKESGASDKPKLEHTNGFRFLDKAAIVIGDIEASGNIPDQESPWKLCTVTQVEEVKILLRLLPIWATGILFSAAYSQMYTTFIQQGSAMNHTVAGTFSFPPATLSAFHVFCAIAWVFAYNKITIPVLKQIKLITCNLSPLQRMGIGRFMIVLTMAAAAFTEMKRLDNAKGAGIKISIAWQLPQYFLIAGAEIFNNISQLEFFYGEAPETMKSMCTAFALLTSSMGNYVSSIIVTVVGTVTKRDGKQGWLSDDLNQGHLDYYFWGFASLCAVNFVAHLGFASKYKHKKVICKDDV